MGMDCSTVVLGIKYASDRITVVTTVQVITIEIPQPFRNVRKNVVGLKHKLKTEWSVTDGGFIWNVFWFH